MLSILEADCTVLKVRDNAAGVTYLVDMGAEISTLLFTGHVQPSYSSPANSPAQLFGAEGSVIRTFGMSSWCLHLRGHHFTGTFILAEVKFPLLEADFLRKHS